MLLVVLAGCHDGETTLEDVGSLCVLGDGDDSNTSYAADTTVDIHVVLEDCASGCASDVHAACTIEQDGSTLRVSADGGYSVPPGGALCPAVCVPVEATCTSEPLTAGTYTVEYGGETTTFVVPSMGPPAQIGDGDCGP